MTDLSEKEKLSTLSFFGIFRLMIETVHPKLSLEKERDADLRFYPTFECDGSCVAE